MAKTICVLGISLGTRALGFAVLKENKLIDWHIKSFKEAWSKHKETVILKTIEKIIKEYQVNCVAIKSLPQTKPNRNINRLLRKLEIAILKKSFSVHEYSIDRLKLLQQVPGKSKLALMHHVVLQYPSLKYLYHKELNNRNPYHLKIFEAVLAARQCQQQCK
jgi:RNase H-fold protein (predicted Holliday junction resolvase)